MLQTSPRWQKHASSLINKGERFIDVGAMDSVLCDHFSKTCGAEVFAYSDSTLPSHVRVCSKKELSDFASVTLLHLRSIHDADTSVETLISNCKPAIVTSLSIPVDSLHQRQFKEWDYRAVASLDDKVVLFAAVKDHAGIPKKTVAPTSKMKDKAAEIRTRVHFFVHESIAKIRKTGPVLTAESAKQQFWAYRPPGVFGRKLKKLVTEPRRFFGDSRSPLLRQVASIYSSSMVHAASQRAGFEIPTGMFSLPKRSIVIALGADADVQLTPFLELLTTRKWATEIVIVADPVHASLVDICIGESSCPRVRAYFVHGKASGETLIRYGCSRSYSRNVAILGAPWTNARDDIAHEFRKLDGPTLFSMSDRNALLVARRELMNTAEEQRKTRCPKTFDEALQEISNNIRPSYNKEHYQSNGNHQYSYMSISPKHPFLEERDPVVTCLEKRVKWQESKRQYSPKVSIIMTVFHAEEMVAVAIRSVLEQTYKNFELIVVEDCGNDQSLELLQKLAEGDSRIRVLQTASNGGTYCAKNAGLMFATGKYVTFHDSDDISTGNRIEAQVDHLEAQDNAIANYTYYQRISESGNDVWFNGRTHRPGYITLMFRRTDAFALVGFFDSVRMAADTELVERLRVASRRPVVLLPTVSYFALQAEGSLTTNGAGALTQGPDGRFQLPPIRQAYREGIDEFHRRIVEDDYSPFVPFPLGQRPFSVPARMLPDRDAD